MAMTKIEIGQVVRIRRSASRLFGGCTARVVQFGGRGIGVSVMSPGMGENNGPWWFMRSEISASREEGDA
jgi:hypothetical protein